ncbi:hypothetical protein RhiirA1_535203 [Rhizophagus irregularis]|uniref:Uncharacterized protein n=1 Tax=Rhizophagus irregularis TaxID=588596 RepID=A0A2I1E8H9_9GLOM|nr:hypothetical protein RhiirA1_535203 [Rhizophagus irregularis]PKY18416.1 hypothetical protein RhiirB3_522746 [Rhizophagus irregularis]
MILGIGIDIIHLSRIKALLTRKPTSLLHFSKRILSDGELKEFNIFLSNQKKNLISANNLSQNNSKQDKIMINNNIIKYLAVRWTLKEAAYKALFPHYRLTWKDISISKIKEKPYLMIHNVSQKGNNNIKVHSSVSHDEKYVISQVLIEIETEDIPKDIKFDTWDEVDNYFDDYGARNGFAIIKYKMKRNSKGQVHKRTLVWVTTFVNQHNHELIPKTQEFSTKYRTFTNEALNEILLITKYGSLTLTAQRNLLKARFPDLHFQDQGLANIIHKYKIADKVNNDTSALLTTLMQKKAEDLHWIVDFELDKDNRLTCLLWMSSDQYQMPLEVFIIIDNKCKSCLVCQVLVSDESLDTHVWILKCIKKATKTAPIVMFTDADPALDAAIPIIFSETYPVHCIFHIVQNLPKNLKAKLGEKWDDFIKQFYQCRNSLCEPLFKQRWNQLLIDYPMAKDILLRTLD